MTRTGPFRPVIIGCLLVLFLFLITLAVHLLAGERNLGPQGLGGIRGTTDLLLKILGGLLILIPLYAVFARLKTRRDAASTGIMNVYHDVLQRLREKEQELERLRSVAEARAQEVESYNENILRSVASGVITFNQDRVVTTFNDAAAVILRMDRGAVIGKTCTEVFGEGSKVATLLERCLVHGEVITREQFDLVEPAGRIWVGVSTSFLKDRAGRLIGTTFIFTDLTQIKALQEQVELRERMTVLGEMSAGIAHEFRNYMGTILGAAKLIARQAPSGISSKETLQTIFQVIADMDHLITQFLNFARKTELDLKLVAVEPWLQRVLEQVLGQALESHPNVEVVCFPDVPDIRMDEVLMRQALGNLIQNAVEAMPAAGQLKLMAGLRHPSGRRREIELQVSDTGAGIPKDRLGKIFLPFFTTKSKGTGLGLALVHKIVLLHNGRIEVESQEGKGTTFHIYLPIS